MGKKKKAIVTTVIRYLIILIFCVPMIMPLLWMLTTALKDNAAVFAMPPQWIPKVFHWENFTIGLQQIEFWKRFGNTVFISVIVCFGQVCSKTEISGQEGVVLPDCRQHDDSRHGYGNPGIPFMGGMRILRNLVANDYPGFPRCTVPDFPGKTVYVRSAEVL